MSLNSDHNKLDERILSLVKSSKSLNHRCFFVLIGENTKRHIPLIYNILSSHSSHSVESIMWCHKNTHIVKDESEFFKSQDIQFVSYNESDKILGQTVDLLVLQDFESLTPNLIALSVETVRGGGIVVLLLDNVESIDSLISGKSSEIPVRYNRRLFRSLTNTKFTMFLNSAFQVLPVTKYIKDNSIQESSVNEISDNEMSDNEIIDDEIDTNDVSSVLVNLSKTPDQTFVIKELLNALNDRTEKSIYSLLAGRGRGKSVALGIAIARAVDMKYSSIYISAPALENIKMVFEFTIRGLEALGYKKYKDFKIVYSFKSKTRLVFRIEILRGMKQTVEYFSPFSDLKYHPDMFVIDEAAAIPLPLLKKLLVANLIIMATTSSGYEGTGRAFSTKMTEYLKRRDDENPFTYKEMSMTASIRYGDNDPVEKWLNKTLLLNVEVKKIKECPLPQKCQLYYVDRDVLFSGNSHSEVLLNDVFSLFISSHYKNSPNDIQILADNPNHEIFTLLSNCSSTLPRVLCAIHVSFEGRCERGLSKKGNLIPWVVSDTHFDAAFTNLLGLRIVRIAVHPEYMSMGYGSHALNLLVNFLQSNQNTSLTSLRMPQNESNVMFHESEDIIIPKISWIGTSFGVTGRLLNFWKKHDLIPICIKQTVSYITGEYTLILIKSLDGDGYEKYYNTFKHRFIGQLGYSFRDLDSALCLTLLYNKMTSNSKELSRDENITLSSADVDRLQRYCRGTVDLLQIIDIIPLIARKYFSDQIETRLSLLQQSILLMMGCQYKSMEDVSRIHKLKIYEVNTIIMKIMNLLREELIN